MTHLDRKADILRRALVEHPPGLKSEKESVAYFRGFVAGAQRTERESERFLRLKDLCHRIAADYGQKFYEDNVSAAYEGLLNFLRKRRRYTSLTEERKIAAVAIRHAIVDMTRVEGDFGRTGSRKNAGLVVSQLVDHEGRATYSAPASQDRSGEAIDWKDGLDSLRLPPRSQRILELLGTGYKLREVGEELGLTEGRVCQIAKGIGRDFPQLKKLLLGVA